jgi:hypothetical protein
MIFHIFVIFLIFLKGTGAADVGVVSALGQRQLQC